MTAAFDDRAWQQPPPGDDHGLRPVSQRSMGLVPSAALFRTSWDDAARVPSVPRETRCGLFFVRVNQVLVRLWTSSCRLPVAGCQSSLTAGAGGR
jgi:hypothetical protein